MQEDLLKYRDIANFQGENVPLHKFISQISAMEGERCLSIFNPWNNVYNGVEEDY